jgi:DNA-directed RNA polymerase subunit omega
MSELNVREMLDGKASRYALVIAVAKRAREITEEVNLRGEITEEKSVNVAIKEFEEGLFSVSEAVV